MPRLSLPLSALIHENLSIILTFAYSRDALEILLKRFRGEWKYLRKTIFTVGEQRAFRACIELAVLLRTLDDEEGLSAVIGKNWGASIGLIVRRDKPDKPMSMRDLCNKVIHAASLEFDLSDPECPRLVCVARESEQWVRAEIKIQGLAALCGILMH